eukprot:jgi/Mesvir1/16910/Mv15776-RA.1
MKRPHESPRKPQKVIIDTDPGTDDAIAIFLAFNCPELEVIALTTTCGNVRTADATRNALYLLERLGKASTVPVIQGALGPLKGGEKERVASFVHGMDGLGDLGDAPLPVHTQALEGISAAQFIVEAVNKSPGEIAIIALGNLTNIALALRLDARVATNVARIIFLGGAFFVNGNVNPAAEANVFGDPEAAESVFTSAADVTVVGLDVTTSVALTERELEELRTSEAIHGVYLHAISQFYLQYHKDCFDLEGIYLHDAVAVVAAFEPSLFDWVSGAICVVTEGKARGHTILDKGLKKWVGENDWTKRPPIKVAVGVNAAGVMGLIKERLMRP